jgi:hypothetical protein
MNRSVLLATAGAAAVLSLAATIVAMHAIQQELDPATHFVSEYAYGQLGWLVRIAYVVAGAGVLGLASSLGSALSGRWSTASAACVVLVGIGLIATGLTRIDVVQSDGSIVSTASGMAHELAGYVVLLGLVPGAFLVSSAFRRDARLATVAFAARLFAWGLVAAFVVAVVSQGMGLAGVGQRLFLGTWLSWLVFVGLQVRALGRQTIALGPSAFRSPPPAGRRSRPGGSS